MLRALELENFKAFGQRVRIELAPITLIFGENSAGKSAILHVFGLLKQTMESAATGAPIVLRDESGRVDLGSFQDVVFDHDLGRDVTFRLDYSRTPQRDDPDPFAGIEFSVRRHGARQTIILKRFALFRSGSTKPIVVFDSPDCPDTTLNTQNVPCDMTTLTCTHVTDDNAFWEPYFLTARDASQEICEVMSIVLNAPRPRGVISEVQRSALRLWREVDNISQEREIPTEEALELWRPRGESCIAFFSGSFGLPDFIRRMQQQFLGAQASLHHFLPCAYTEPLGVPENAVWEEYRPDGFYVNDVSVFGEKIQKWRAFFLVPPIEEWIEDATKEITSALKTLYSLGPIRRQPERWYGLSGTTLNEVGWQGELLPHLLYRRRELVQQANDWLRRLEIGYQLDVASIGDEERGLFEIRLRDVTRGLDVTLPDVGYGVSQLLPIIVQILATQKQVLTIEQPEVHIHPRLQADFGDLLAETIRDPYNHHFIIETHSEHLVLRMQKLIREGRLKPEDVSVIFVSRGETGSQAKRLRLDGEGDFFDDWPGGFFPERLRELI